MNFRPTFATESIALDRWFKLRARLWPLFNRIYVNIKTIMQTIHLHT